MSKTILDKTPTFHEYQAKIRETVLSLVQPYLKVRHQHRYPDHGISVGTMAVPSTSIAILALRRASSHSNKEMQVTSCTV